MALLLGLLQRAPAVRPVAVAANLITTSPIGQLLRAAFSVAALGALHGRAGATTFVGPVGLVPGTVGTPISPVAFTYVGTPSSPARFEWSGTLPPGLRFTPEATGQVIRSGTPVISGTPTQAGNFVILVQGFNAEGLTNNIQQQILFEIAGGVTATLPAVSAHPQSQLVSAGASVSFTVQATGSPAPTFQWTRNGANIIGATSSTFSLPAAQAGDVGTYAVIVTNAAGSATSNPATLSLVGSAGEGTAPTLVAHPLSVTAATGSTVALAVVAAGSPEPTYRWFKDGAGIPGVTDATLKLDRVTASSAGAYSVVLTNASGSIASRPATVSVAGGSGRLANLSVRSNLGAGEALIVGFATNGPKSVLIRGIGPSLGDFGVPGAYADPRLELFNSASAVIGQNEDWAGSLSATFQGVGAFPLSLGSKDAALQASVSGSHSAHLKGPNSGVVLVELYDSGTGAAVRLVNVSARNLVGTGDNILIAGFVVDGSVGKTLLVRAVGPTLAGFGVAGTLSNPKLELYNAAAAKVVENDDWPAVLSSTAASVGAFALLPASRDSALLVTLPPGAYSAQVSGMGGGTGEALIEVYEVP